MRLFSKIYGIVPAFILLACSGIAQSADWSSTNVSYLSGKGYKSLDKDQPSSDYDILTIDHASGWKYGDNFFFTDIFEVDSDSPGSYTEWAPRFSSAKIVEIDYGSFLKDVLLAGQLNVPTGNPRIYLYGLGMNLAIPHFQVFSLNTYVRDDRRFDGTAYQVTLVWKAIIDFGAKFIFTGFMDYAGEEGSNDNKSSGNLLAQPQLLWQVAEDLGVGIEYQYWKNKLGVEGITESVPQLMLKWTL